MGYLLTAFGRDNELKLWEQEMCIVDYDCVTRRRNRVSVRSPNWKEVGRIGLEWFARLSAHYPTMYFDLRDWSDEGYGSEHYSARNGRVTLTYRECLGAEEPAEDFGVYSLFENGFFTPVDDLECMNYGTRRLHEAEKRIHRSFELNDFS